MQDVLGGDLLIGCELVDGFEDELEVIVLRATFALVEYEIVGCDGQCEGQPSDHVQGGLTRAAFITLHLSQVDTHQLGERPLAEAALFTQEDKSFWEGHGAPTGSMD